MSDDDKTVFGQPMPAFPPRKSSGEGKPAGQAPAGPAPVGQAPRHPPNDEDTWLGGALNPTSGQGTPPAAQPGPQAPSAAGYPGQHPPGPNPFLPQQGPSGHGAGQGYPSGQPAGWYQPQTGASSPEEGIFPELNRPAPDPQGREAAPKIALADALRAADASKGGAASNPLLAESTGLLILLGRLRTGLVEMESGPLLDHVARAINDFEARALALNLPQEQVRDAKYALSATADDIVQNLPGADRGMWLQYSMVARFFGERSSGVGFFQKVDHAMKAPGQSYPLLELMLCCLELGFEGQYRTLPNGGVEIARIRRAIYETLRRVNPRPDDDVSPQWEAMPMNPRRRRTVTPVWVVGLIAVSMVVVLFGTFSVLLTRRSADIGDMFLALHQQLPAITIERTEPVLEPYKAPETSQMERIRTSLALPIEAGQVVVDQSTDWVLVRVGEALRFSSGREALAEQDAADELLTPVAQMLDREQGQVRVVGHTDTVPMSGAGRFKTNQELSEARAQTVATWLSQMISDPERIDVEGKGASEPVADNATAQGRAQNRRVEILIPREE